TSPPVFVNGKVSEATTALPKVPTLTTYVYVPAGATPGTRCVSVRVSVDPGGSVTLTGPTTGSRPTGPVTAAHAWTLWGCSVRFASVTVNWKAPPSGPMVMGPPTGSADTATAACAAAFRATPSASHRANANVAPSGKNSASVMRAVSSP